MTRSFEVSLDDASAGRKLSEIRKSCGVTQKGLADLLGVHWTSIHRLENGKISLTMDWCVHVAEALGVQIDCNTGAKVKPDRFAVHGEIRDSGSVVKHTRLRLSWPIPFKGESTWYLIRTDDYGPICRMNDLVQITEIGNDEWGQACDSMCLIKTQGRDELIFGRLDGPMFKEEEMDGIPFRVLNMKSEVIAEMPFDIVGVVTGMKSAFAERDEDIAEKPSIKS